MNQKSAREKTIRDAKSGLILDAARKVFADRGFFETRLEDIADEAGFSKAALYNYYKDKESIFLSLANRDFDQMFAAMRNCLDPKARFIDNLERVIHTVLSFFGEHFSFMLASASFQAMRKASIERLHGCHEQMFSQFKTKGAHVIDLFIDIIKQGKDKGEIKTSLDERVLTRYIESLVRGVIFQWRLQGKKGDIDKEIKQLIVFVSHGLNIKR
jgi:AcrR family transcriptional regulator